MVLVDPGEQVIEVGWGELRLEGLGDGVVAVLELGESLFEFVEVVKEYRAEHASEEPPLPITERARLRELEKEVRELTMKAEFL